MAMASASSTTVISMMVTTSMGTRLDTACSSAKSKVGSMKGSGCRDE